MSNYASPVTLTFQIADIDNGGFHLQAKVAGQEAMLFQVDTGSSGMVMSKSHFPADFPWDQYPCFGSYTIHYYPSTKSHTGDWYYLPVELVGANGNTVQTHAMVLVCVDTPDSVAMMGVSAKGEAAAYNAFLNGSSNNQALAPAYVLNQTSVILGQSHSSGDGYEGASLTQITPLTPVPTQTNTAPFPVQTISSWSVPSVGLALSAPGSKQASPVNTIPPMAFELDTGINQFLVACPQSNIPQDCLGEENANSQWPFTNESTISVTFPVEAPILNYSFKVGATPGSGSPAPVGSVIYMGPASGSSGSFNRANVGICPLKAYSYIYDALNGFLGFKAY